MSGKKKHNVTVRFYTEAKERNKFHFAYNIMIQILLLLFSVLGTLGVFVNALERPGYIEKLWGIAVCFVFIFVLIFYFHKWSKFVLAVGGILYLFFIIKNFEILKEGCFAVMNSYIKFYNQYMNLNLLGFRSRYANEEQIILIFLSYLLVPFIGILSYIIMRNKKHLLYYIVTIPIIVIALTIGKVPDSLYFGLYFVSAIGVISIARIDSPKKHKEGADNYEQAVIMIVFMVVIIASCVKLLPKNVYENKWNMKEIKQTWQKKIENSDISNMTAKIMLKNSAQGGIGEGRLGRVGSVKFKNSVMFKVTLPEELDSLYLRSYVGSVYDSRGWSPAQDKDIEQYRSTLEYLKAEQFSFLNQGARFLDVALLPYEYIKGDITIEDIEANEKYRKVPYFLNEYLNMDSVEQEIKPFENKQVPSLINSYSGYFFKKEENLDEIIYRSVMNNCSIVGIYKKMIETIIEKPIEQFDQRDEVYYEGMTVFEACQMYYKKYPWKNDVMLAQNQGKINDAVKFLKEYNNFISQEKQYRDIVYKEYLDLPENSCEKLIAEWKEEFYYESSFDKIMNGEYMYVPYHESIAKEEGKSSLGLVIPIITKNGLESSKEGIPIIDIGDMIVFVRDYLDKNTTYSLNPGSVPKGKDFIEYFLTENKKGYCSYYATAATIMFRSMGVPARYTEGYVVTEHDIKNGIKSTEIPKEKEGSFENGFSSLVTTEIKDTNAHAWTEIYVDGFGWIPVDVTPGYTRDGITTLPEEITNPQVSEKDSINSGILNSPENTEIDNKPITPQNTEQQKKPSLDKPNDNKETTKEIDEKVTTRKKPKEIYYENVNKFVQIIFYIIGAAVISFVIFIIWFKYLVWKKQQKLAGSDMSVKIGVYYKDIKCMLRYWGIKENRLSNYSKYCNEVEEKIPFQESGIFTKSIQIIVKYNFSENGIEEKELEQIKECYDSIRKSLYFRINKYQIYKLKYINIIYPILWNDNSSTSNIKKIKV